MLDKISLKPVIEAVLFAADAPLYFEKIVHILEGEERDVIREALKELVEDYRVRNGGFFIEEVAGGFQFRTSAEFAPWLRRLFKIGLQRISKAAMESLAIIAYKQPVTRGELESVRGVDSGGVLATLMDKRFIKIVGRKEVPGRPVVYGTTKEFLETFDLKDLSCLPSLKDIQKMEEENGHEKEDRRASEDFEAEGTGSEDSPAPEEGADQAEAEGSLDSAPDGDGEAPEDNGEGRGGIQTEGRGADNPGPGSGERRGGEGAGGQG